MTTTRTFKKDWVHHVCRMQAEFWGLVPLLALHISAVFKTAAEMLVGARMLFDGKTLVCNAAALLY